MTGKNDSTLLQILENLSQNDDITSALAKLGKLLLAIPSMSPNEVAAF